MFSLSLGQTYFLEEDTLDLNASQSEEIHLLDSTSAKSVSNQNSATPASATTGTQSMTTTIYPKNHLKTSKFNLFSRFNRGGEFLFSSSQLFNFLLNRKVLEKSATDYQKLKDPESKGDFNSVTKSAKSKSKATSEAKDQKLDEIGKESDAVEANSSESTNKQGRNKKRTPSKSQFILQNKPPIWNETNQVYQLDFGGRVTQESAKNFQIEFGGKQVMQFGRIDPNSYTLDFEWPFTAVQAFSIALANITQRFKWSCRAKPRLQGNKQTNKQSLFKHSEQVDMKHKTFVTYQIWFSFYTCNNWDVISLPFFL